YEPAKHIAGTRRREPWGRVGIDRRASVRSRDHRFGALEKHHRAAFYGTSPRAIEAGARHVAEQARELAVMGRQYDGTALAGCNGASEPAEIAGERRQRIGVEN